MSAYERRNQRAIAEGWTGYGQKRHATQLGYKVPAEYHAAKQARPSPSAPIEPSPFAPRRTLRGGGVVGRYAGRIGIQAPYRPDAMARVESELRRYAGNRRIQIWAGDVLIYRRTMSLAHFLDLVDQDDGLYNHIAAAAAEIYEFDGDISDVTITIT